MIFKKLIKTPERKSRIAYMYIFEYTGRLLISRMYEFADVARGAYYVQSSSKDMQDVFLGDVTLLNKIEDIVLEFSSYGYCRVTAELRRRNFQVNHKKVFHIMRHNNLTMKKKHSRFCTTNSNHSLAIYPNLAKEFIPCCINQLWVADITYIRLKCEFAYVASVLDSFSRKIVGWSLKECLDHELTLSAFRKHLPEGIFTQGLLITLDRGMQYTCKDYTDLLEKHGILISIAATSNPYGNAQMESFIAIPKMEVYLSEYDDVSEALSRIGYFIEDVYNTKRLHSSLGYLLPGRVRE